MAEVARTGAHSIKRKVCIKCGGRALKSAASLFGHGTVQQGCKCLPCPGPLAGPQQQESLHLSRVQGSLERLSCWKPPPSLIALQKSRLIMRATETFFGAITTLSPATTAASSESLPLFSVIHTHRRERCLQS